MKHNTIFVTVVVTCMAMLLPACGNNSGNENNSAFSSSQNNSDSKPTERESKAIDREITEIESLNEQFESAYERGDHEEAKRLSDKAWNKYQALQEKNLNSEQQARLSKLFAL